MWRKFYVLMAEENGGEGGGGGSSAGDAGQDSATESGATDNGNAGSVLASAGGQQQTVSIPEKYQVKKEDGTVDIEASSLKLAEAYGHLEKRLGSGDAPPKTVGEYQIAVPEALKDSWNPSEDKALQDFLGKAHAAGITQAQLDLVMGAYHETAGQLVNGARILTEQDCVADLRKEWKTDDQYKAEVGKAYKTLIAYAGQEAESIMQAHGNDPALIRLLARVGNELSEDSSINPGGTLPGGQTVESLMMSEAYMNPKHPDHVKVSGQVQAYFNQQANAAAKSGNAPLM